MREHDYDNINNRDKLSTRRKRKGDDEFVRLVDGEAYTGRYLGRYSRKGLSV